MNKSNIVTIAVAVICVILAGSLIGVMANYSSALNTNDCYRNSYNVTFVHIDRLFY